MGWRQINWVMGGFHLLDSHVDLDFESREELDELGQMLNRYSLPLAFRDGTLYRRDCI